jgi:predicted nuclease with TOPRIM domain
MSTRAAKKSQPQPEPADGSAIVQQVLAERRELMISNERLRLELDDLKARQGKPDPKVRRLEEENRQLREELATARAQLERLEDAVHHVVDDMRKSLA